MGHKGQKWWYSASRSGSATYAAGGDMGAIRHVGFEDAMGKEGWAAMGGQVADSNELDYQEGEKY